MAFARRSAPDPWEGDATIGDADAGNMQGQLLRNKLSRKPRTQPDADVSLEGPIDG